MRYLSNFIVKLNGAVGQSRFGRLFRLEGCGHENQIKYTCFSTEIRAGLTTFFTMVYIIAVNASVLSQSGGTCVCNNEDDPTCANDEQYSLCVIDVQRELITATAAISGFASILFGLLTNLPVSLAPGMGRNAYFAFQVVGFHGTGSLSYRLALTAVFIEGLIFMFLSLIGMRQWLVKVIPASLKIATGAGIGLFLALIGLSPSAGIGIISGAVSTPLDLAGCPEQYKDDFGVCTSHKLQSPTLWIGIFCGGILIALLIMYQVKSAMIVGIALVSILSWPRPTDFTFFPYTPEGDSRFEFFKNVVTFYPITNLLAAQDWNITAGGGKFVLALFTFLYIDILDCTGTLYSMARFAGVVDPSTGDFPRSTIAYSTDAFSISVGSLFGSSPVTAFIESAAGITEGGRTGITAITTGTCFLISIFFAPILASIPPWATGSTLVLVGWMMARSVTEINWSYPGDAIPAFVTLIFIPFSYSVAYGLIAGMMTYVALNGPVYLIKKLSGNRIVPPEEDLREYWTYKPSGGTMPWFLRYSKRTLASRDSEKELATDISRNSIAEEIIIMGSKGGGKTATAASVV